ncbi:MAG TPA: hypothetical protein VLT33_20500 [Labilithrix sp.]|nr:hypothetical protein [Labilithrix sp.]
MKTSISPRSCVVRLGLCIALLGACSRRPAGEEQRAPPAPAHVPYGTAMADVARRFELLGRASAAGRYDLAQYELGEISELFEDTLPHATPPREGHPEVLPPMAKAFMQANVPDLQRALAAHDRTAVTASFERTAAACNGCHQASGHAFIEVPLVAGRSIPSTDPVSP